MQKLLKIREVAERLNVSPRTVYRMIADGKIGHYIWGKQQFRISEEQLEEFLTRSKKETK